MKSTALINIQLNLIMNYPPSYSSVLLWHSADTCGIHMNKSPKRADVWHRVLFNQ